MKATQLLHNLGQSIWLDNITRDLLDTGTLKRYIDELSVTGLTSNPTIFNHAIKSSSAYSAAMGDLDGDNMPDLAVANFTSQTVTILKNKVTDPAIVSFTPAIAVTGTTVTINGANFTGATAVSFGGGPATSSPSSFAPGSAVSHSRYPTRAAIPIGPRSSSRSRSIR